MSDGRKNYQKLLDDTLQKLKKEGQRPRLLLHACCAPCSSYVLEYLTEYFDITLFFYNPNISPEEEYRFRYEELCRLVGEMKLPEGVSVVCGSYDTGRFEEISRGLEDLPEGGSRCMACYRLRLRETARVAAEGGYDFFCTTLSISPYKNAAWLNTIGEEEGAAAGVPWLSSDFKKRGGYKRSCELSELYGLYRQNYCGCIWSKRQREAHDRLCTGDNPAK